MKKGKREKNNKKVVGILFACVGILVLVLIGLVLNSFGFFEENNPEYFAVKDECSLMMGNLIHQIRDDGECRNRCVNECSVQEMDFVKFSFEAKNDDCSLCGCWCD